jgi:lipopolysaccharide/colanic/teichoic acid biosynthesis glycosyltransferase
MVFLAFARGLLYLARLMRQRKNLGIEIVLIVGDNDVARDIVVDINRPNSNYRVHGVVGDQRRTFTTHKTWAAATRNFSPNIIIQVATRDQPTIDPELLSFAEKNFAEFKFVPSDVDSLPDRIRLELFMGDVPMMSVEPTRLVGWGRVGKRLFDVVLSGLALVVLSPVFLVIGIVNKIIFGHIFYMHTRLTRGDQKFSLFKFQTVRNDLNHLTPEQAFKKIGRPELIKKYRDNGDFLPDDPRYGVWSKFLRRTSLDELPQFWNVLRGDISLVGPRALIPEELNGYEKKHAILNVKSGITGLAQIAGRRDLPWEQRRKLDVYYVQNWSFGLDIQILFKTAWQVLTGRGAK